MRRLPLLLSLATLSGAAGHGQEASEPSAAPHIVLFLADDLGWNDVGYHGSRIETPNIDRLAAGGVRLEQFYVQPKCSPTRAALLTGRYPIRTGLQHGVLRPWADFGLDVDERLLSNVLQEAGYVTAILGKWHLGFVTPDYLPTRRGFDRQYGFYNGSVHYVHHSRLGGRDWNRDDEPIIERGYATDLIAEECVRIIEEHDPKKPLFLYVPFSAPHTPLQAPRRLADRPTAFENEERNTYALMVTCMDEAIGTVVAALDRRGMRENTLILFASDNGADIDGERDEHNAPLRGGKGSLYEGGVRVPALVNWPARLSPGTVAEPLHVVDLLPTFARLAGASTDGMRPLDGRDAWPTIAEGAPSPHADILLNIGRSMAAVRAGDWKLVRSDGRLELYDLNQDPAETSDLAAEHPERVVELVVILERYEKQAAAPRYAPEEPPEDFTVPAAWGHAKKRRGASKR